MKYTPEQRDALLTKLEKVAEKEPDFSPSDVALLHEIIKAARAIAVLRHGFKWVVTTLGLIAVAITSWKHVAGEIKRWLAS